MAMPDSSVPVPFSVEQQLCHQLEIADPKADGVAKLQGTIPDQDWLPGNPNIRLSSPGLTSYVYSEIVTPRLNKMHPYLWLVATQSSAHVTPLHAQRVRGRDIVIAENPELHLVWIESRVFIKPLPQYLLSHAFWQVHLAPSSGASHGSGSTSSDLSAAALGYMRTWHHLVRHESDFRIAQDRHLIPADVTWPAFAAFVAGFALVADERVSPRYQYGELRLTRLNLWAKLALGQWHFQRVAYQYGEVFARYYAPILFVFGAISVLLSAMQLGSQTRPEWSGFLSTSALFAVVCLVFVAVVLLGLAGMLLRMLLREFVFAVRAKTRRERSGGTCEK